MSFVGAFSRHSYSTYIRVVLAASLVVFLSGFADFALENPSISEFWAPCVSFNAIGSPSASTTAWISVGRPPRERPMQSDPSAFFNVGCMLAHADARAVDHLNVATVSR
jgi:hypothetical protein